MVKLVLFVGDIAPHGDKLRLALANKGYSCSRVRLSDEVDQAGKQFGKALLVFTDHKFAYRFLLENRWHDFSTLNILYTPVPAKANPENQKKLDKVNLKLYDAKKEQALLDLIHHFISSDQSSEEVEIEFLANTNIGAGDD